jgi:hypothetical protein
MAREGEADLEFLSSCRLCKRIAELQNLTPTKVEMARRHHHHKH